MFKLRNAIVSHVIGWIIFLSLPLLFLSGRSGLDKILSILFSPAFLLFFLPYFFLFYLNTYILIPQFYFKGKAIEYFIFIFALLILFAIVQPFDHLMFHGFVPSGPGMDHHGPMLMKPGKIPPMPPPGGRPPWHVDAVSIYLFVMILLLSLAVRTTQQWRMMEQRATRAEADKANAELSFLKAQINPHFLFNTLNNIYSLAVSRNENTAASIMRLSNIMRYVTDDITEDFVPLSEEIDCIRDYIDLQKLRLGKKMNLDFECNGDFENKKIPPLILMTFIENIFKYGISNHESSDINIKIYADLKSITFFSMNRVFGSRARNRNGIGIANVKKRLEHLYGDKHFLNIVEEHGNYIVQLTLQSLT